jgi:hypothetical protein
MDSRPNDVLCASPLPRFAGKATAPSWLLDALDPPLPLVPEPRQDATDPPHIRTPEPKRKRLATPEPPRKTPRLDVAPPTTSASRRCAAYAFGEDDDPDAEWSTLARTKRKVPSATHVAKPSGTRHSGRFHLPLRGLARGTPAPEVTRRVITYLPPPRASKTLVDDVAGGPRASTNHQVLADEAIVTATTTHAQARQTRTTTTRDARDGFGHDARERGRGGRGADRRRRRLRALSRDPGVYEGGSWSCLGSGAVLTLRLCSRRVACGGWLGVSSSCGCDGADGVIACMLAW